MASMLQKCQNRASKQYWRNHRVSEHNKKIKKIESILTKFSDQRLCKESILNLAIAFHLAVISAVPLNSRVTVSKTSWQRRSLLLKVSYSVLLQFPSENKGYFLVLFCAPSRENLGILPYNGDNKMLAR